MRRQSSDTGELERGREAQLKGWDHQPPFPEAGRVPLGQNSKTSKRAPSRKVWGFLSVSCLCSALGAVPPAQLSRHYSSPVVSRTASPPSSPGHVTEPCPQCAATKPRHQTGVKVSFQLILAQECSKGRGHLPGRREKDLPKKKKKSRWRWSEGMVPTFCPRGCPQFPGEWAKHSMPLVIEKKKPPRSLQVCTEPGAESPLGVLLSFVRALCVSCWFSNGLDILRACL